MPSECARVRYVVHASSVGPSPARARRTAVAGGRVHREHIVAVDRRRWNPVCRSTGADVRVARDGDERHLGRVLVVLAHEQHRQLPDRGHVEGFVERAVVAGAVAKERHRHAVRLCQSVGIPDARRPSECWGRRCHWCRACPPPGENTCMLPPRPCETPVTRPSNSAMSWRGETPLASAWPCPRCVLNTASSARRWAQTPTAIASSPTYVWQAPWTSPCWCARELLLGAPDDEHLTVQLDQLRLATARDFVLVCGRQRNNHKVGRSTRCLMRWRKRAAGAPSTRRWSNVRLSVSMRCTAICSVVSSIDDRPRDDAAHAEDRTLRQIDDGREGVDFVHAEIGDRERGAREVLRPNGIGARGMNQTARTRARWTPRTSYQRYAPLVPAGLRPCPRRSRCGPQHARRLSAGCSAERDCHQLDQQVRDGRHPFGRAVLRQGLLAQTNERRRVRLGRQRDRRHRPRAQSHAFGGQSANPAERRRRCGRCRRGIAEARATSRSRMRPPRPLPTSVRQSTPSPAAARRARGLATIRRALRRATARPAQTERGLTSSP